MKIELLLPWFTSGVLFALFASAVCYWSIKHFAPKKELRHVVGILTIITVIVLILQSVSVHLGILVVTGKEGMFGSDIAAMMFGLALVLTALLTNKKNNSIARTEHKFQ